MLQYLVCHKDYLLKDYYQFIFREDHIVKKSKEQSQLFDTIFSLAQFTSNQIICFQGKVRERYS